MSWLVVRHEVRQLHSVVVVVDAGSWPRQLQGHVTDWMSSHWGSAHSDSPVGGGGVQPVGVTVSVMVGHDGPAAASWMQRESRRALRGPIVPRTMSSK